MENFKELEESAMTDNRLGTFQNINTLNAIAVNEERLDFSQDDNSVGNNTFKNRLKLETDHLKLPHNTSIIESSMDKSEMVMRFSERST